ncbi:DUF805 domain-containing protein [Isoptericola croceus]|uniref:DUF805 domain-containing protein n=1 Tax=Isoptericola croceus TaxID=3031406 RepID=UPI0023F6D64A|nr:DUF805 domain-containing protein [Isoptericola croceus]
MSFGTAVKTVFSKYATFSGRARRSEFWFWALFLAIVWVVVSIVAGPMMASGIDMQTGQVGGSYFAGTALYAIVGLAFLLPNLAVTVRRLHDQDKPGVLVILAFIPVANIVLLVFMFLEGTRGPNQFGPDPKAVDAPAAPQV